jgi:predicted ATPase
VGLRQQFHLRLGERKERGYRHRAHEIAAELAAHFEQGRDYPRAVEYLYAASKNDLQRYAYREAITHLTNGLRLLERLPETQEREKPAMSLLNQLTGPVTAL